MFGVVAEVRYLAPLFLCVASGILPFRSLLLALESEGRLMRNRDWIAWSEQRLAELPSS